MSMADLISVRERHIRISLAANQAVYAERSLFLAFVPPSSNFPAMNKPTGQWIINYGLFLIVVGTFATLYNPGTGEFGFNPAAKTALISGAVCGGISILWGFLVRTGFDWARVAAFLTTFFFGAVFTWRSIAGWRAFAAGQTEKWFAATLITLMLVASIGLMIFLLRGGSEPPKKNRPGQTTAAPKDK
jgi:hypothetical protein